MMIDMNGPDIEAVSEDANSGICQSVEELQASERGSSRVSQGARRAHATRNVYFQLSGLEDPVALRQRSRHSKESRMSVMFLKHWVSTSVTPECL